MTIRIRAMTEADIPFGMHLRAQANWNQTEADWRRFLHLEPAGCFLAELDGVPAGTTCAFIFGEVAWIAAVLVEESLRGRGLGRALMEHALAFLDGCGVPTVRLDATPQGRPLYEKLGFVLEYELARFAGVPAAGAAAAPEVQAGRTADLEEMARLDQSVTFADRRKLLAALSAEQPQELRIVGGDGRLEGYLLTRPGSNAHFIGPCIGSTAAGPKLLADALGRHAGKRVFVDIPLGNLPAVRLAEEHGLARQRPLSRMCRGVVVEEKFQMLWASSGPEKG